jgi:hypothetical protein
MRIDLLTRSDNDRPAAMQDVHFHRGPQGHPMPCYDERCSMPQMASDDVREAATSR